MHRNNVDLSKPLLTPSPKDRDGRACDPKRYAMDGCARTLRELGKPAETLATELDIDKRAALLCLVTLSAAPE